jgi:hypothetical protein
MNLMFRRWQLPYLAAVSEDTQEHLRERVHHAETMILTRLEELSRTSGPEIERQAINEALDNLHIIKRNKLGFPKPGQGAISLL